MTRAETLLRERSRLVEEWKYKSASERAKLLVQIMDIEEEVDYSKRKYLRTQARTLYDD